MIVSNHLDRQFVNPTGLLADRILPTKGPLGASWVQRHSTTLCCCLNCYNNIDLIIIIMLNVVTIFLGVTML